MARSGPTQREPSLLEQGEQRLRESRELLAELEQLVPPAPDAGTDELP